MYTFSKYVCLCIYYVHVLIENAINRTNNGAFARSRLRSESDHSQWPISDQDLGFHRGSGEDFRNNRVQLAIFGAVSASGGNTSLWVISSGHRQNRLLLFRQRFTALLHWGDEFPHRMVLNAQSRAIHHGGGDPMSTLQIGISSPDISVLDERYATPNDGATPPPAPRTSLSCRSTALVHRVDPQTAVVRRGPLATAFLEDLRDAIVALDALGRCLFVNRAFETMTGSSRTELLGTVFCERIDDPQQSSWSSLARIFATPASVAVVDPVGPLHSRFKMQRADGSYLDAAVRWDRFPGSRSIGASFLLCKELMTTESELQSRMTELRILRDELNVLLAAKMGNESTAYGRWEAHTNQHTEAIGPGVGRPDLSRREQEVLHSVLDGNRIGTIAATLFLSENTVRNHLKRIYKKLGVRSLGELREHCSNV